MDKETLWTEYYTNVSDPEYDEDGNYSSDDVPSEDSSVEELIDEPERNTTLKHGSKNDTCQSNSSNVDNNSWTENSQNPELFSFEEDVGLKWEMKNFTVQTLVDLFFSEEFLTLLFEQTNLYAAQEIAKQEEVKKSIRVSQWKDVNTSEMKLFIGLLLQMGPCCFPSVEHYWSTNKLYNVMFWRSRMSRNKFQLLLRYLHFADNSIPTPDRFYNVRPVINHFNDIMHQNYVPNKNICIDESVMLWSGRLYFCQYIRNKKYKYSVRLHELYESDGVVMKIAIHSGKSEEIGNNLGHTADIVLHLLEDYLDKGYALHMDSFYNSVKLTKLLTTRKTYVCGNLRMNRRGNPRDVENRILKNGDLFWQQNGPVTVCKWKEKREMLIISNMHVVEMVEMTNRNGKPGTKPNIVRDYNQAMSGIDRSEQMVSSYTALKKAISWPKKVALHIIEIYIQNAHKMYQEATSNKVTLTKFREEFVDALLNEEEDIQRVPKKIKLEDLHYLQTIPRTEKKQHPTKPCRVCLKAKKRRESRYFCPTCVEKPPLCVEECFKNYHKQ